LLGLLAALSAFVYFYEARGAVDTRAKEQEVPIFTFAEGDVVSIGLRDGEKVVELVKGEAGHWRITAPESGEADDWALMTLLWRLAPLNADRKLADSVDDPASYGLDSPQLELRLGLHDGAEATLSVGDQNTRGTGYYARKGDSEALYLINSSLVNDLRKLSSEPPKAQPTPTSTAPSAEPTPESAAAPEATPTPEVKR
jgi:hypothetical protein